MTVRFADSLQSYGGVAGTTFAAGDVAAMAPRGWTVPAAGLVWEPGQFTGSKAIRCPQSAGASTHAAHDTPGGARTGWVFGIRCKLTTAAAWASQAIAGLYAPGASATILNLNVSAAGHAVSQSQWSGQNLDSGAVINDGAWHYIEISVDLVTAVTSIAVDGAAAVTATQDYNSFPATQLLLGQFQGLGGSPFPAGNAVDYSDIFEADHAGAVNNGIGIGPARIECLMPTGDGSHKDFIPDTGAAHWSRVNEQPFDGLTSHVDSATAGAKDSYTHAALSSVSGTVKAVSVTAIADKASAPARSLAALIRSGTAEATGTAAVLATLGVASFDPQAATGIFEIDPNTAVAWTLAGVNAAEIGVTGS